MDIGIKFPDDADVAREQARRFRELDADRQRLAIDEMYNLYHFLLARNDHPEKARQLAERDEARSRAVIEEFAMRHGQ